MNKPKLSLALSLSLVLLQANLLSAHAEPQGAIWQRMSSSQAAGASKVSKTAQKVSSVKRTAPVVIAVAGQAGLLPVVAAPQRRF
jgi:hypothetical protein